MLAQTLQVTGDPVLAWLTGIAAGATVVMAAATLFLALQTRASVEVAGRVADAAKEEADAAKQEADATLALVSSAGRDRDLAVQPVLVLTGEQASSSTPRHGVQLRNIGRGPAIRTRVFLWGEGNLYWNSGPGLPVAASEALPRTALDAPAHSIPLDRERGAKGVTDIPGAERPMANEDLWAYCLDQLGNALKFNLRTGDPPEVSRSSDLQRPTWVTSAFETYASRQPPDDPAPMVARV